MTLVLPIDHVLKTFIAMRIILLSTLSVLKLSANYYWFVLLCMPQSTGALLPEGNLFQKYIAHSLS